MKKGFVTLVGAGPGDKGLLTLKGRDAILKAEVVVYDALVSDAILALVKSGVETINVGKRKGNHLVPQEGINEILLEKALEGKRVVRLKGGDPFVFGRGGEELFLLKAHNIPFEVIPGITSAIGAPMYAGIPVTHRKMASSFHVLTGHYKKGDDTLLDFESLVKLKGTLIFLMGVTSLSYIVNGLLKAGMGPKTPSAIIENGTTPYQRQWVRSLDELEALAKTESIKAPSCIVVGEVCSLSETFNWFSKKPLLGKTIIVTRPEKGEGTLSEKLRDEGAFVIEYPCIQVRRKEKNSSLIKASIHAIGSYDWLVFTSKNGVHYFFETLFDMDLDVRALGHLKIAVVGPQTESALKAFGLKADYYPTIYNGDALGRGLGKLLKGKDRVLLMRGELHGPELTDHLKKEQITYEDVCLYETSYIKQSDEKVQITKDALLNKGAILAFTSGSAVDGFIYNMQGWELEPKALNCVSIGPMTQRKAKDYGFNVVTAKAATIDSVVEKIEEMSGKNGIN